MSRLPIHNALHQDSASKRALLWRRTSIGKAVSYGETVENLFVFKIRFVKSRQVINNTNISSE